MRKIWIALLAVILVVPMLIQNPLPAQAAPAISVYIDGARLSTDQAPVSLQGRVMLPLRAIFEALDSTVDWNQWTQTVTATKGSTTVVLKLKSKTATINNQTVTLDVPAQAISGRTMVPVRFVSEALGATVNWNSTAKTVTIASGSGSGSGGGTDTGTLKAAQYVTLRDVANTGDGRDLQVSFSRSETESLVDHYRLLIVKASNASSFNLNAALKVGSANYTTLRPSGTDPVTTLSSGTRDVDGALIQSNQAYVGYVLTVGKGNYGTALSNASSSLTLDTGISVAAATNVRINDISDYADGRDLAVTFTRASSESNISEYRVFVVKTKDASSFSLSRANSLSSQYYTTVSKTSSSNSTLTGALTASSRDTSGDLIKNNVAYTAFVLAVSNTSLASNKLSTASSSVTLAAGTLTAPVITLVQDITDYGDGRDLRVSFTKIADESKISGYRIFVVKAGDYSNFTLARANAVSSSNYTEVSKTGYNQSPYLPSGARDVDGATIRNGVNYRVFVMAVGSGAYSGSNALSSASSSIVLTNNYSVGAVNNLYVSDVNDYNDGRDLFVSYTRASDESNISHYRIMVVKTANAGSFTLTKATNVSSSNYTQVSTGRDYSDVLPSGARDVDGARIQNGVSYRVFVLSVGKGSYAGVNTLSDASTSIVLTNNFSVGTVSGLTVEDTGDRGDGRDLKVTFNRVSEESNISGYRVFAVKASKSLTVSQASSLGSGYYTAVSKSGSTNPLTNVLNSGMLDTDGDRIQNNIPYRIYVLSVGSGSYAGSNALSDPSASITLTDGSLVQAVTYVSAVTPDSSNSTGQPDKDIKVSFTKAANETNILEYRILVVPASKIGIFDLAYAETVLSENYTPVPTGSNVSDQTLLSNKDAYGETIEVDKIYHVFVLSKGKPGNANALSAASNQFKVSPAPADPAEAVTNISALASSGDAPAIDVTFTIPSDVENIDYYAILAVDKDETLTLSADILEDAVRVANNNTSGTVNKDIKERSINEESNYDIYVISVHKDHENLELHAESGPCLYRPGGTSSN